jgi:hypothetical protein
MKQKSTKPGKTKISDRGALVTLLFVLSGTDARRDSRVINSFCDHFDIAAPRVIALLKAATWASRAIH